MKLQQTSHKLYKKLQATQCERDREIHLDHGLHGSEVLGPPVSTLLVLLAAVLHAELPLPVQLRLLTFALRNSTSLTRRTVLPKRQQSSLHSNNESFCYFITSTFQAVLAMN